MVYKAKPGETEFGGVGGMYPDENVLAPSLQQEMWAMYATNEGGAVDPDGTDTASEEWGRTHIGEPDRSFSVGGAEPAIATNFATDWPPPEEEEL